MARWLLAIAASLLVAATAAAQPEAGIQWSQDVEQSVALAQHSRRPLMFWVLGRSGSRNHRIESEQREAFRNPLVAELASRFVPVKLSRSRYRDQLEQWRLSPRTNLQIVFATPAGELIDTLSPLGVADADALARKMTLVFRHYRQVMFDKEIKPVLEDKDAPDQRIEAALKLVGEFLILPADQSVAALLKREALDAGLRKAVYETLAVLSTPGCVKALLAHASDDEVAAAALARCTPDAAEQMLPALEGDDPNLRLLVYHAVTRVCKIEGVKADRFWRGRYEHIKQQEIERVRRIVTETAQRWRDRYADYR